MARKGILGTKLGMTQVFDENNKVVPVTVVKAGPNVVTRIRTPERDGYSAVQLAYGEISPRKINKPVTGQYAAAGVNPRRYLAELRLDLGKIDQTIALDQGSLTVPLPDLVIELKEVVQIDQIGDGPEFGHGQHSDSRTGGRHIAR